METINKAKMSKQEKEAGLVTVKLVVIHNYKLTLV